MKPTDKQMLDYLLNSGRRYPASKMNVTEEIWWRDSENPRILIASAIKAEERGKQ